MTKTEYCHRVADFDEAIWETENEIASIKSKLLWDDESRKEWYLEKLAICKSELEDIRRRRDAFTSENHDKFFP